MLFKIALVLGLLVLVVLLIASFQPSAFRVERSITITAPADAVFAEINGLQRYAQWNPWRKHDPQLQERYAGPAEGVGASYAWESGKVGTGTMTIVESVPAERVRVRLDFLKPLKGTNTADFLLASAGDETRVTWAMYGDRHFVAKIVGLVVSMDRMIGPEFEKGLQELKAIAESSTRQPG